MEKPWYAIFGFKPAVAGTQVDADGHDVVQLPAGASAEEQSAFTATLNAELGKRVSAAVDAHPVVAAAEKAGVKTAQQFTDMHEAASSARADLQASVAKEANRCFGAEKGPAKAKALESASYEDAKAMRDIWKETADASFGATDDAAAKAQTAAVRRAEDDSAVNAAPGAAAQQPKIRSSTEIYADREKHGG